jgi:hypothetical protein
MPEATKSRKTPAKPRKTTAKAKPEATETRAVTVTPEEIRKLAHQYWIDGGHREGHHHEDWARAEADLRKRAS